MTRNIRQANGFLQSRLVLTDAFKLMVDLTATVEPTFSTSSSHLPVIQYLQAYIQSVKHL